MQNFNQAIQWLASIVWGWQTVLLLLGVGVYLTFRLRVIQFRRFPFMVKLLLQDSDFGERSDDRTGEVSPVQALMVSLANTVGMGNIAGVCTAIAMGGPGAVFWMWLSALFGMATKLVEAILGQRYKAVAEDGSVAGGPMYYLGQMSSLKWLGGLFACVMGCKALVSTSVIQSNSIAMAMENQWDLAPWICGIVLAIFTWLVIIGGLRSIVRVVQVMTPVMVVLYLGGAIATVISFADKIPHAFSLILVGAFNPSAVGGGVAGAGIAAAMRYGLARGAYSNEAGTGTAGIFHATAKTNEPVRQGLLASFDVFIDTIVICSLTALAVLTSGAWTEGTGVEMTVRAFTATMPTMGGMIVAVSSLLFGFSSLVGTTYLGETAFAYLFGAKAKKPFRWCYCVMVLVGANLRVEVAWSLGDVFNGMMALVNLIGIIGLSGLAVELVQDYFARQNTAEN